MIKLVENVRSGEKIKQIEVLTIGVANNQDELESLERIAKAKRIEILNGRNPVLPGLEEGVYGEAGPSREHIKVNLNSIVEEKRINVGVNEVFGQLYSQLDFEDIIVGTRKDEEWNDILKQTVLARLLQPTSKRKAANKVLLGWVMKYL